MARSIPRSFCPIGLASAMLLLLAMLGLLAAPGDANGRGFFSWLTGLVRCRIAGQTGQLRFRGTIDQLDCWLYAPAPCWR
jgi:hypothetical protein